MGNGNPDNDFSARARLVGFVADALGWMGFIGSRNSGRDHLDLKEFQSCGLRERVTKN